MYTIKLKVKEHVIDKILYFLKSLPENEVKIIETSKDSPSRFIDFSKYKITCFKKIKNPVSWQKKLRDEWQ